MGSDGAGTQHPAIGESMAHPAEGLNQGQEKHQQVQRWMGSQGSRRWTMTSL